MFQGINGGIRDETLLQLTAPTMFVQVVLIVIIFQFDTVEAVVALSNCYLVV